MAGYSKNGILMVHLHHELKKELALQAVQEGRSMSEIVRHAVVTYLRANRLQVQELPTRFTTPEAEAERQRYIQVDGHAPGRSTSGYADGTHTMTYNLVPNEEA